MSSEYLVGVGMHEITDPATGLAMQGFADPRQKSAGVESRLFARAFVVASPHCARRIAIVCADIWAGTQVVKQAVVARLRRQLGADHYAQDNLLFCGTHTHSAPGGFSGHRLYDLTAGGFDPCTFECIVSGAVRSVVEAHRSMGPGRVYVNRADLDGCGRNRSREAYLNNPEQERARYASETDQEMLLLKLVRSADFFFEQLFGTCRQRTPRARSSRRVASERSWRDASLGAFRSTWVLGARRRHAPKMSKKKHARQARQLRRGAGRRRAQLVRHPPDRQGPVEHFSLRRQQGPRVGTLRSVHGE